MTKPILAGWSKRTGIVTVHGGEGKLVLRRVAVVVPPVSLRGPPGGKGDKGDPGSGGTGPPVQFNQATPNGTWIITHNLNRRPAAVTIYLNSGEEVEADVVSTTTVATITFATAQSGQAVLI
jgi:hypothetical protein